MNRPAILDAKDRELQVGSKVRDGGGTGLVFGFMDGGEYGWKVGAGFPDGSYDLYLTSPADMRAAEAGDTTLRCDDLEIVG